MNRRTQQDWPQRVLEALPYGVALSDATEAGQPVVYVNAAFERLTGHAAADMTGRSLAILHEDLEEQPGLARLRDAFAAGSATRTRLQNRRSDGTTFWMDVEIVPVHAEDGSLTHWVSLHREAQAPEEDGVASRFRAVAPELLQRQDPLTGFRIREAFAELLEHQLAVSQREHQSLALFLVEVDDFDRYTDTFDRSAGDALLRRVGMAMSGSFRRRSDLLARAGDCSFAALAHGMTPAQAEAHADALVKRVRALALHHPRSAVGRFVTLSVGIAVGAPGTASHSAEALEAAAQALHEARAYGGNRHAVVPMPGAAEEQA